MSKDPMDFLSFYTSLSCCLVRTLFPSFSFLHSKLFPSPFCIAKIRVPGLVSGPIVSAREAFATLRNKPSVRRSGNISGNIKTDQSYQSSFSKSTWPGHSGFQLKPVAILVTWSQLGCLFRTTRLSRSEEAASSGSQPGSWNRHRFSWGFHD